MTPRLQPPGAALPLVQRLFLKHYIGPFVAGRSEVGQNRAAFEAIHRKTMALVNGLSDEQLQMRVLVPPQAGLEDSSRYWSSALTIEHLLTVGEGMKQIVKELGSGRAPGLHLSTAAVKPQGAVAAREILARYQRFGETCMAELDPYVSNGDSEVTQDHPWFGPFRAQQWHWLLASHSSLHYRQLKNIAKGL